MKIERFFDWVYGKIDAAAQSIGAAAVEQARTQTAAPARKRPTLREELEYMLRHVGPDLVGLPVIAVDGRRVVGAENEDEFIIRLRCPVCRAVSKVRLSEPSLARERAWGVAQFFDYVLAETSKVGDAHVCQLELAP